MCRSTKNIVLIIAMSALPMFAFQNCSEVRFANMDDLTNEKAGLLGDVDANDDVVGEIITEGDGDNSNNGDDASDDGGDPSTTVGTNDDDSSDDDSSDDDSSDDGGDPSTTVGTNDDDSSDDDSSDDDSSDNDGDDNELSEVACGAKKVMICHYPPGNPAARHTICIGEPALKAHMSHKHQDGEQSDTVGACPGQ